MDADTTVSVSVSPITFTELLYTCTLKQQTPIGLWFRLGQLSNQTQHPDTFKICPNASQISQRSEHQQHN